MVVNFSRTVPFLAVYDVSLETSCCSSCCCGVGTLVLFTGSGRPGVADGQHKVHMVPNAKKVHLAAKFLLLRVHIYATSHSAMGSVCRAVVRAAVVNS